MRSMEPLSVNTPHHGFLCIYMYYICIYIRISQCIYVYVFYNCIIYVHIYNVLVLRYICMSSVLNNIHTFECSMHLYIHMSILCIEYLYVCTYVCAILNHTHIRTLQLRGGAPVVRN